MKIVVSCGPERPWRKIKANEVMVGHMKDEWAGKAGQEKDFKRETNSTVTMKVASFFTSKSQLHWILWVFYLTPSSAIFIFVPELVFVSCLKEHCLVLKTWIKYMYSQKKIYHFFCPSCCLLDIFSSLFLQHQQYKNHQSHFFLTFPLSTMQKHFWGNRWSSFLSTSPHPCIYPTPIFTII